MIVSSWKALVPLVSYLSIFDSTGTSKIEPRFFSIRSRGSMWYEHFHCKDYYFCDELGTQRGVPDPAIVIIPREIGKVLPHILPPSRIIMPEAPLLRWVQRLYRSDRTVNRNKDVIGGAQRRIKFGRRRRINKD